MSDGELFLSLFKTSERIDTIASLSTLEKYICVKNIMQAYPLTSFASNKVLAEGKVLLFSRIRGFYSRRFQGMLSSLRKFDESEVAQQRLEIINFYEKYGEGATKEAFGADRKVISRWKKRLKESGGKLMALIPFSTRPHK